MKKMSIAGGSAVVLAFLILAAGLEVRLAIQENPLDAASHFLLGSLLERNGERDQAIVAHQRFRLTIGWKGKPS